MAETPSTMVPLGTRAPAFSLPDVVSGREVSLSEFEGARALVVMFICRHCPYVVHVREELVRLAKEYILRGTAFVGISANDAEHYPEDTPENLREMAVESGFPFPLLYDETQEVAKAYKAACTPDFFLFDGEQRLAYRGQLDGGRPGNGVPVDGRDLRAALDAVLEGWPADPDQRPSLGCNIKWIPGNEPDYAR